jgi:FMN-dependent NADH-azoreductase
MTKLLFLQGSPRKGESQSVRLAQAYLEALCGINPDLEVDTLELWDTDLPAFDGDKAAAKMTILAGEQHTETQRTAWNEILAIADRFIAADRYLIASPMWNSGIPYRLKQYIDLIHQPNVLWTLDPQTGYHGLLRHKHATLTLTSGVYSQQAATPAFGVDHHSTYLRDWLNQAGVTAVDEIRFQPTMLSENPAEDLKKARAQAVELAHSHGRI